MAWWYKLIPSWAPSWLVELVGGIVAVGLALVVVKVLPLLVAVGLVATLLSAIYEAKLDANGWSWSDLAEREAGILGTVGLLWYFKL